MILEAAIIKIKEHFFVVDTGHKTYRLVLKTIPVEAARLRNHCCSTVAGITEDTPCEVEVDANNELIDLRFDVPDVEDREEVSTVVCLFAAGKAAIMNRVCGCPVFISSNEIIKLNPRDRFDGFTIGQQISHKTVIDQNQKVHASCAYLVSARENQGV